ncbi:hypothetical protein BS17DRAFT_784080 [Gyrodon lividus]|nr:hypothetical protein BS17DRAFT_784080 [Gyrodon lividus]
MEDAQPNELRLSRKGSTSVPIVRSTHHGASRGRPATTFSGRGRGCSRGNPSPFYPRRFLETQTGSISRDPVPNQPSSHAPTAHGGHAVTTLPQQQLLSYDSRPWKRVRLEMSDSVPLLTPPRPQISPGPGSSGEKVLKREYVKLMLPQGCRKGEHSSHKARQTWIQAQKKHLETERHLLVMEYRHLELEQSALFICRPKRVAQWTEHRARESEGTDLQPASVKIDSASTLFGKCGVPPFKIGPLATTEGRDDWYGLSKATRTDPIIPETSLDSTQNRENGSSRGLALDVRPVPQSPTTEPLQSPHDRPPSQILGKSLEKFSTEKPVIALKLSPTQRVHTLPIIGQWITPRVASTKEDVIDLTLDSSILGVEECSGRWTTFRSGTLNVLLPPSSNASSRYPSLERLSTGSRPRVHEAPLRVEKYGEGIASSESGRGSDQPSIPPNHRFPAGNGSGEDSDLDVPLSDLIYRHDDSSTTRAGHSRGQPIVLDDEPEVLLSPTDEDSWVLGTSLVCGNSRLPLGCRDKPRRVLHDPSATYIVTAHGIVDQVSGAGALKLRRSIRSPVLPFEEFVEDACILPFQGESAVVLAHTREENQLTLLVPKHGHASRPRMLRRDWNTGKKPGVSALAALTQPFKFASGGHDHRVHLWDVTQDLSGASAIGLPIKHTSMITSLLPVVDTSHKLISVGADCNIHLWDMSAERVAHSFKTSSIPYHVHKTDSRFCTLLEVAHLEMQFELRDLRMVPVHAVQRFGFVTAEKHGRFMKGDTWSHFFVCGDRSGGVRLWDLRNFSTQPPPFQCFKDPVVQVVKTGPHVLACSKKNELALINFEGG